MPPLGGARPRHSLRDFTHSKLTANRRKFTNPFKSGPPRHCCVWCRECFSLHERRIA